MSTEEFSYDQVPYPSYTFPQTHPDRLATLALRSGLRAADPSNCRVLELGCGDGTNLLSLAYALPDSSFVGIDLSAVHIERAQSVTERLDLTNVTFEQADVTAVGQAELGKFDFIVAHGLFSWVPDIVRDAILRIYQECLTPNGVGYISYNLYPGCHIREMTSGIMKFQSDLIADPAEKVSTGVAFLNFVAKSADGNSLYKSILEQELGQITQRSQQNIFHDDLSDFNQPFYFHEFCSMLGTAGLQFVAESNPAASFIGKFDPEVQKVLSSAEGDVMRKEQLIDLIRGRRFRSSLVCRGDIKLERSNDPRILSDFYLASRLEPMSDEPDFSKLANLRFSGPKDESVEINHPLTKAALFTLYETFPANVKFADLVERSAKLLSEGGSDAAEIEKTSELLLRMFDAGMISLHLYEPKFVSEASDRPHVSEFARWQVEIGSEGVSTLTGANLRPTNDVVRALIMLADGSHDREELINTLAEQIEVPDEEKAAFAEYLPTFVDAELANMARAGLLVN